ncbi:hypothetical protein AB0M36_17170 [Actinoplanes sp. NPDC051346]|uniref:hypothetical protein n=1 Tax=Actinoplanes sp. NPDC051346 TaxID=3155048 RepID=UPI00344000FC
MADENTAWQLEDFVDSLVVELDKTRETLAVKAVNKPLSYSVKELSLDLNTFPSYDGDQVRFVTAQPGQEGASKITIHLNSITDQQVRATTKLPGAQTDIPIARIPVDKATKKKLRRLGIQSVDDLEHLRQKNVDLGQVSDGDIDYSQLNKQIQKSRRDQQPPQVKSISLGFDEDSVPYLSIEGRHLSVDPAFPPVAAVNRRVAQVLSRGDGELRIRLEGQLEVDNELILALDEYSVVKVNVKAR